MPTHRVRSIVSSAAAVALLAASAACTLEPRSAASDGEGAASDDAPSSVALESGASSSAVPSAAPTGSSTTLEPPAAVPDAWRPLIGEYVQGGDTVSIMEDGGELKLLRWNGARSGERSAARLEGEPPDVRLVVSGIPEPVTFQRSADGEVEGIVTRRDAPGDASGDPRRWTRLGYGVDEESSFRIDPVRPVEELRPEALAASPPAEAGPFAEPDLVELTDLDPTIRLDVRYATTDNFMGARFYQEPRAFLQRPAAEAVLRAHRWLSEQGYGVIVFDGYRPWHVTKMFWDATPDSLKLFVANPAGGSRHNRGGAVDLSLYDLDTGQPVEMPGGYDEFSPRASPHYRGGTMRQRWFRDLLRTAMEAQGFAVYEAEWWHFDHESWRRYGLGNRTFEELVGDGDPGAGG